MADATDPALCNGKRCFDEILLSGLQARIRPDGRDRIVVLHMLGNHGPAYYQRYPPAFQIGRASCRERVCQYVSISVVAVSLKKKSTKNQLGKTDDSKKQTERKAASNQ